jgi:exopolyphosphatase / guanosine-5'-triphosphate,3'-diphosphate pyrophosphatase
MTEIIHRWEWRAFGSRFPSPQAYLDELGAVGEPQESDEIYLVAPDASSLKIRFGVLDLKVLLETDRSGLQLWAPIAKVGFPADAAALSALFEAWGRAEPHLQRSSCTQQQFVEELIQPLDDVAVVEVHKRRVRYAPEGCMAEMTELTLDGTTVRTVAVEAADPTAVLSAVEEMGLRGYENASYARGLSCLLGRAPVRYAVIDVGTNSVKFHVGEQHPDGAWSRVLDRAEVTRLGEGLADRGEIQPDPMERTAETIARMAEEARSEDVMAVAAVGTAGMRMARNRDAVIARFRERAGIDVEVVSGEEESRLAYLAAKSGVGLADGSVAVFDSGGGSTQFTFGKGSEVEERFSVDVGAVRYTERFGLDGAVEAAVVSDTLTAIAADLERLDDRPPPDALVAMGGAVTNLAAVAHAMAHYDPDIVQGSVLEVAEVDRQIELFRSMDAVARRSIVGIQPARAEVILAGAGVVRTVMAKLGCDRLTVSDRGLRHGLLMERFGLFG